MSMRGRQRRRDWMQWRDGQIRQMNHYLLHSKLSLEINPKAAEQFGGRAASIAKWLYTSASKMPATDQEIIKQLSLKNY